MDAFSFLPLLLLPLSYSFLPPTVSATALRRQASLFRSHAIPDPEPTSLAAASAASPITYFQVTKPIPLPNTKPHSYVVLEHEFAKTYGKPPVLAHYKPPAKFQNVSTIVLEWTATSKGRQFDRIFGVWVGGVEILRSCTAEPTRTGIVWTVKKDVTKYSSLLSSQQTLAVYLGNLVDDTYTGVYHVNLTFHFYPPAADEISSGKLPDSTSRADLIIPISRNLPLNDGLWFNVQNYSDAAAKVVQIPPNTYRAVLEVYVSFHEKDEFWFGNLPSEYTKANGLTDTYFENGPFREVIIGLDGVIVGAIWPFSVIYTGGLNPLLWRPITAIGSFDLPTYDIEITPFLGKLLDGKGHTISFNVTNALNVWLVDANLHLWLDKDSEKTEGELLKHSTSPLGLSLETNFKGSNGSFVTKATRTITSIGRVKSSRGVIKTEAWHELKYRNDMIVAGNEGNLQILEQNIELKRRVVHRKKETQSSMDEALSKYHLYVYSDATEEGNGSTANTVNVTLGMDEKRKRVNNGSGGRRSGSVSRVKNFQSGDGYLVIQGKNLSGLASTEQDYEYSYYDGNKSSCYSRKVGSSNYTILHDKQSQRCSTFN